MIRNRTQGLADLQAVNLRPGSVPSRPRLQLRDGTHQTDHDLVFTRTGNPIAPPWVSRRFPKLAESAGLPRIRFHDLRHTWATLALADGIHPKIVSERLGHSSVAITLDIYSHVTATLHADAAQQIASLLIPAESHAQKTRNSNLGHLDGTSAHVSE